MAKKSKKKKGSKAKKGKGKKGKKKKASKVEEAEVADGKRKAEGLQESAEKRRRVEPDLNTLAVLGVDVQGRGALGSRTNSCPPGNNSQQLTQRWSSNSWGLGV